MRTRRQAAWLLVDPILHYCSEPETAALRMRALGATDALRGEIEGEMMDSNERPEGLKADRAAKDELEGNNRAKRRVT